MWVENIKGQGISEEQPYIKVSKYLLYKYLEKSKNNK